MVLQSFNPTLVPQETLKKLFIQRDEELDRLMRRINSIKKGSTKPQFIIIGPRGIGKTHFLLIIYYKIKEEKELRNKWIPLKFTEEEYMIDSISSLFIRILEELSEEDSNNLNEEILGVLNNIENFNNEEIVDFAIKYLKQYHEINHKGIVLLIDNINDIFEQIKQIGGKKELGHLRAILMEENFLIIIGGAVSYFNQIRNYNEPFYNFFEPIRLTEFTDENVEQFIIKIAKFENNDIIIENFQSFYKPRIKTLIHFTGGNPRLILEMYYVFADFKIEEVKDSLEKMLNQLTPYYQGIMAGLSAQQRKIIDTMALMDGPATPTEIAKKARMNRNIVNSQMKRLEKDGLIRLSKQRQRKTRRYEITERFFRIWREMRKTKGNKRIGFLVNFLKHFYSETEIIHLFEKFEQLYSDKSKNGEISECKKLVDYMGYLSESAPPGLSINLGCNIIEKYLEIGDIESAEYELIRTKELASYTGDNLSKTFSDKEIKLLLLKTKSFIDKNDYNKAIKIIPNIIRIDKENPEILGLLDIIIKNDSNNEEALYWKGRVLLYLLKYKSAKRVFNKIINLNPNNENALIGQGITSIGSEEYDDAIKSFENVIKLNPKNKIALNGKGNVLYNIGKYNDAIDSFNEVIKLDPKDETALLFKGKILFNQENYKDALKDFNKVLKLDPKNEQILELKGCTYCKMGKYKRALGIFEEIIKINPNNLSVWETKAHILDKLELYEEALKSYNHILKKNPNNEDILNEKGSILLQLDRYDEALEIFNGVLKRNPINEDAIFKKGKSLQKMEKYKKAIIMFDKFIKMHPNDIPALGEKGCTLCKMGEYKEANLVFNEILKIDSNNERAWATKAHVLDRLECYDEAINAYDNALGINPNNEESLLRKSLALINSGMHKEARNIFEKLLKSNPDNERALLYQGISYSFTGNYEKSIISFDMALKLNPKNEETLVVKGIMLLNSENFEAALEIFKHTLSINPTNERALKGKGISFFMLNDVEELILWYNEVSILQKRIDENWLFETYQLEKYIEEKNIINTLMTIQNYKGRIKNKKQFEEFIDGVTMFSLKEIIKHTYSDLKKQNIGHAHKKMILLLDNHIVWKNLETYNILINFLIEVLKIDFKNGKNIYILIKEKLGTEFTQTFEPIELAINYLEMDDIEILERLHPEVREIVEEIILKIDDHFKIH